MIPYIYCCIILSNCIISPNSQLNSVMLKNIQGKTTLIYDHITKTSNSGLFTNHRLAIFSPLTSRIGYISKVSDHFESLQDPSCWSKCKQTVNIRAVSSFMFHLKPGDKCILVMRWKEDKQKQWEFKFDNQSIAAKWHQQITFLLYPPPPLKQAEAEVKPNYSKLQTPSRFNAQNVNNIELIAMDRSDSDSEDQQQHKISQREVDKLKQTKIVNRFQEFQKENATQQQPLPIITTFRQKISSQSLFNNTTARHQVEQKQNYANWNLRWYEVIQDDQREDQIIAIYHQFTNTCKNACLQIIQEVTVLKKDRIIIPISVTMNEEIYIIENIIYRLLMQRDIGCFQDIDGYTHEQTVRQEFENFRYIIQATRNRQQIKVPMVCMIQHLGFVFFCEARVPKNYFEVDQTSKYLLKNQITNLQQQLKLKINPSNISLCTNKPTMSPRRITNPVGYIIMRGLRQLLPTSKRNGTGTRYCIPKQIFLEASEILQIIHNSNFYQTKKDKFIDQFLKNQFGHQSTIISHDDLTESLAVHRIPLSFLDQIIARSNNLYLNKIMITQIVSNVVCDIIHTLINKMVNKWKSQATKISFQSSPNYQTLIYNIVSEFCCLDNYLHVWEIINQYFFQKYSPLVVRKEDLIVGYFLSSVSRQTGVQFDYQLFINLRRDYFTQSYVLSKDAIREFHPIINGYTNEQLCLSYQQILIQISSTTANQKQFNEVAVFYDLNNSKPSIQPRIWLSICRFLSYLVPYRQQEQYFHLGIYSSLNLDFLNYDIFTTLVSAMKWLLLTDDTEEVFRLISLFKEESWFWVSSNNPFIVSLYQIMSQYYKTKKQLQKAIDFSNQCIQLSTSLYKAPAQLQCLDINFQLAQLYVLHHKHRQALDKYRSVKQVIKRYNHQSSIMLDLLRQISKMYLHLGDVETAIKYCRQTIDYSLLNPFKDAQYEFQIYAMLVRSLQIKDEQHKFKYYVDIIEDKFGMCNNPYIVKEVLKLTFQQYIQNSTNYHLKKMAFVLYYIEKNSKQEHYINEIGQIFRNIQGIQTKSNPCRILREQLNQCVDIADEFISIEKRKNKKSDKLDELSNQIRNIIVFCQFVSFQFVLGHICSNLKRIGQ